MNVAFMFPGTNSQRAGMGRDLYLRHRLARELYEQANDAAGFDLARISFSEPPGCLAPVSYSQPAILAHSVVLMELMKEAGILPVAACGHSLGEFAALVAAGVIAFPQAIRLVYRRARLIEAHFRPGRGSMMAVTGASAESVARWCQLASGKGVVEIANHNGPRQIVVSGEHGALREVERLAMTSGGCQCTGLPVRYPFHTRLMKGVEILLAAELSQVQFNDARIPVASNSDGSAVTSGAAWRELLLKQLSGAVRWDRTVDSAIAYGVSCFVELGPGRILQGLIRRMAAVETLGAQGCQSLGEAVRRLHSLMADRTPGSAAGKAGA